MLELTVGIGSEAGNCFRHVKHHFPRGQQPCLTLVRLRAFRSSWMSSDGFNLGP